MTNKEAIERLQKCKRNLELGKTIGVMPEEGANERIEAYDLAIKALQERLQGKWIHIGGDEWCCSECGHVITTEGSWENPLDREEYHCIICGANMRKGDET